MTPADCLAVTLAAGVALYVGYRVIMWMAERVIDCLNDVTQHERH